VKWMARALELAHAAAETGEVPVGAVLVRPSAVGGELLAAAHNAPIARCDPTAHAEILALRAAGTAVGNYRLPGTVLYVTLEPCPMCTGALIHARVGEVVFAAADPRTGALGGALALHEHPSHNHRLQTRRGPLAEEAGALLRAFFRSRRGQSGP